MLILYAAPALVSAPAVYSGSADTSTVSAASAAGMRPTSSVSTSSRARNRFFMCFPPKTKKFCPPESADRCSKTSRTKFLRSAMQLPVPAEMPAAFGYSDLSAFRRLHSDRLAGLFTRIPPAARSGEDCAVCSSERSVPQHGAVVNAPARHVQKLKKSPPGGYGRRFFRAGKPHIGGRSPGGGYSRKPWRKNRNG